MATTAPTPKAVAIVLFPALVLMLAFAFFYVGAFHEPTPHHVPLAVVGPPTVAAQLNRLPGEPLDARQASSRRDALSQIDDRKVYGAYEAATNRLFVASAANRATAVALEQTFDRVAAAQGRPAARVTDVKPLPLSDPNGTAAFYAVIAWVFGGYIGATLIGLIGSPRSTSRRRAAARIGALAGFAIVAAVLSVAMLRASFDTFSGHVVAMCAIGALTIFAGGAATAGIQAAAGPAGTALVILVFVILGNSASGGPFARPLLPGLWRTIGGVLPPGAGVDLARSALFFDGARVAGPIIVLVVWAALGTALALALGGRMMNPVDVEAEAAAGAAV
ncbi:MAG TPA: ABC transporter permease [Solirubrobacteraceae bacterium]|nr:ABC transporter permease [Solirubrobacteraceae bacterium]